MHANNSNDKVIQDDFPTGLTLLRKRQLNKGTAFTEAERDRFGLRGLLPPHVHTQQEQVSRVLENFRKKPSDIERYVQLMALYERNRALFFRVVMDHLEEVMPILYTPTVGQACQEYGHIYREPHGIFISANDQGRMADVLRNWPYAGIRLIVVTDGERILGLGDLGADGMGIPVGKTVLYTACAGIDPMLCLPITLDVGTENETLLNDPLYIGLRQHRLRGQAYDDFIDEFIRTVQNTYANVLIQFEDFAKENAFKLLARYKTLTCAFNDDIQGTGSVGLAGIYTALRKTGGSLKDQRFLFAGAGEAGIGMVNMILYAMEKEGINRQEALNRFWLVDSKGLIVKSRTDLAPHKKPFVRDSELCPDLLSIVKTVKPTCLIGACGQAGAFTQPVLEAMAEFNSNPIIFAFSNPTSKTECTAEHAYMYTKGKAIYASGSPFAPVTLNGQTYLPSQGNNAYIFPGLGLGTILCGAAHITDEMFYVAAKTLANEVSQTNLDQGRIFPPLSRIRQVSISIATEVARIAYQDGISPHPEPDNIAAMIESQIYEPVYQNYV